MPTRDIRIGEFEDTEMIELPRHWRFLFENREWFFEMLMENQEYVEEITNSPTAMGIVMMLDKE